jgi:hypothetical protein
MGSFLVILDGFLMRHRSSPSDEQNHRGDDLFRARLDQITGRLGLPRERS